MNSQNSDPQGGSTQNNGYNGPQYGAAPDPGTSPFGPAAGAGNSYEGQFYHQATGASGGPGHGTYEATNGTGSANGSASSAHSAQGAGPFSGPNGSSAYRGMYGSPIGAGGSGGPGGPGSFGGGPVPGYFGPPLQKPRQRWSTALLAITAVLSLVLGGAIGTQLDNVLQGDDTADPGTSEQQAPQQGPFQSPQPVDPNATQPSIDAGEKVESAPGVVLINTLLFNGAGAGTGMILNSDGLILTNYHVVSGSETVTVSIADTGEQHEAEVLGHDATRDVAVLQITDGSDFDTVSIGDSDLAKGDAVSAIGNGSGQGYLTELLGEVTGLDQTITAMDEMSPSSDGEVLTGLIATDADVVPGYSGGPLMNENGEVVGVTTAASQGNTSEQVSGYAVPIATAMDIADQITSGDVTSDTIVVGRNPALGVTVAGGNTAGAEIVEVLEGSAAAEAGVKEGDTVTALDGKAITDPGTLSSLVKEYSIGDTVTLDVTGADGTERQVDVKLSESTVN